MIHKTFTRSLSRKRLYLIKIIDAEISTREKQQRVLQDKAKSHNERKEDDFKLKILKLSVEHLWCSRIILGLVATIEEMTPVGNENQLGAIVRFGMTWAHALKSLETKQTEVDPGITLIDSALVIVYKQCLQRCLSRSELNGGPSLSNLYRHLTQTEIDQLQSDYVKEFGFPFVPPEKCIVAHLIPFSIYRRQRDLLWLGKMLGLDLTPFLGGNVDHISNVVMMHALFDNYFGDLNAAFLPTSTPHKYRIVYSNLLNKHYAKVGTSALPHEVTFGHSATGDYALPAPLHYETELTEEEIANEMPSHLALQLMAAAFCIKHGRRAEAWCIVNECA